MPRPRPLVETLKRARALVKRGWCRFSYAEDARGRAVDPLNRSARRFCVAGAIRRVAGSPVGSEDDEVDYAIGLVGGVQFNTTARSRAEVLARFDTLIAQLGH
jgi:hypothetical protein